MLCVYIIGVVLHRSLAYSFSFLKLQGKVCVIFDTLFMEQDFNKMV